MAKAICVNRKFITNFVQTLALSLLISFTVTQAQANQPLSDSDSKIYKTAFEAAELGKWDIALSNTKKAKEHLPAKAIRWLYYKSSNNKASFSEITGFIKVNSTWPYLDSLREQAEQNISTNTSDAEIFDWFSTDEPKTPNGLISYANVLKKIGKTDQAKEVIRKYWVSMDMNSQAENDLLKQYKKWITPQDNEIRLERLLWEGQTSAAQRQAKLVSKDLRSLAEARIALRLKSGGVDGAINKVPSSMKNHPGLIYERMRWRSDKKRYAEAIELLQLGVDESEHADLWWRERGKLARYALKEGDVTLAYELASNHQATDGFPFADAEWLAGWIALRYLDLPDVALKHFSGLHDNVSYPVSLARGGYWAGRAAEATGDIALAQQWYKKAAMQTTSYYGQLAAGHLNIGERPLLPVEYEPTHDEKKEFEARELIRLIPMLVQAKADVALRHIIRDQIKHSETESDFVLLAQLSHRIKKQEYAVYASREAIKSGYVLIDTGYPILSMPNGAPLEDVLAMAIIRQESAFQLDAQSRVGARGLMQLMPATAKNTAKLANLKYNKDKLSEDGQYNIHLGSFYLNNLIKQFDGSLPMAFAGYNAGPQRSKRWAVENGDPRQSLEQAIDWIELIPFNETQNYVQRVLENMVVYQQKINGQQLSLTQSAMNKTINSN